MAATSNSSRPNHNHVLADRHLRELRDDSAIDDEVLAEDGYRTVTDPAELLALGFDDYQCRTPGYLLPLTAVDGTNGRYAFKPDQPRVRDGKPVKYEFQPRQKPILDVSPRCLQQLRDPTVRLLLTEGKKKESCLASHGYCAIDVFGVHNWYTNPEHGGFATILPLEDWAPILDTLDGRVCCLAFDSDSTTKPSVALALRRLANWLTRQGALVFIVRLPDEPDGSKNGVDDFIARYGADAFTDLVANAEPWGSVGVVRKLEAELRDLRAQQSAQASVLRNPDLTPAQKLVAIATIHDAGWRGSKAQPTPYRVRSKPLAEAAGVSQDTVSQSLKVLCADDGVFAKQVTREFTPETGWTSAMFLTPRRGSDVLSLLKATAEYTPEPTPQPPRRRPRCPLHPYADVHQRSTCTCMECGQVLVEREQVLNQEKPISETGPEESPCPPSSVLTKRVSADSAPLAQICTNGTPGTAQGETFAAQRKSDATCALDIVWARERGWLRVRDPSSGEWIEIPAKGAPSGWARIASENRV